MDALEALREWRGLVARQDAVGLVARLQSEPWPDDSLQLVGEGLLNAIRQGLDGSTDLGEQLVARLREREWTGDDELAQDLESALGTGPTRLLRPLPVDLEELAMVLEGDPVNGGGRIELSTGAVWPELALQDSDDFDEEDDEADQDGEDGERWLWVDSEGSRPGYRDMERFIDRIDDAEIADRLSIAITGRGAFRRFKDTLHRWPELVTEWNAFSDDRKRGRARAWLADHGYTPTPSPR